MVIAPNFRRPNVVAGFSMDFGTGRVPLLSKGLLFAQGLAFTIFLSVPAAPANQFSYLAANSGSGLYWTTNPNGTTADDAVIGWVRTNATDIIAISHQIFATAAPSGGTVGGGPVAGLVAPPTPSSGIAAAGGGTVTWAPITFAGGADVSSVAVATIQLLYQDATAAATAHLTAGLVTSGVSSGDPATLLVDVDLTGIVHSGDWILIGGEMLFVTADATISGVAVDRALGLTVPEAHAIADPIYLLLAKVWSYAFPLDFFSSGQSGQWGPVEGLVHANIALFNVVVFNVAGAESAEGPVNYSQAVGGLISTGAAGGAGFHAHGTTSGSITPPSGDPGTVEYGPMTGAVTVGPVSGGYTPGTDLRLKFIQDGVGGRTVTFDSWWKGVPANPDILTRLNTYAVFNFHARGDGHMELNSPWVSGLSV